MQDGWLTIVWKGQTCRLCRTDELKIKGGHNIENALAAASAAFLGGARIPKIIEVLKEKLKEGQKIRIIASDIALTKEPPIIPQITKTIITPEFKSMKNKKVFI